MSLQLDIVGEVLRCFGENNLTAERQKGEQ